MGALLRFHFGVEPNDMTIDMIAKLYQDLKWLGNKNQVFL